MFHRIIYFFGEAAFFTLGEAMQCLPRVEALGFFIGVLFDLLAFVEDLALSARVQKKPLSYL